MNAIQSHKAMMPDQTTASFSFSIQAGSPLIPIKKACKHRPVKTLLDIKSSSGLEDYEASVCAKQMVLKQAVPELRRRQRRCARTQRLRSEHPSAGSPIFLHRKALVHLADPGQDLRPD